MLLSHRPGGREARFLSPLEGVNYSFVYAGPTGQQVSANSKLLELVILDSSPDCPHQSLRKADGHFHTGDLFLEVQPGQYLFRGRDDDWIKSINSLRCDTRSIEENVRATCGDLVNECIVVGTGRPSPALFVEPAKEMDHEQLKLEIIRRTRAFHSRRYLHERITDPELVIVVEPRKLPRTAVRVPFSFSSFQQSLTSHFRQRATFEGKLSKTNFRTSSMSFTVSSNCIIRFPSFTQLAFRPCFLL